ncbi:MAG: hypothetical protein HY908_07020 [Myxococcales bacterium]|nr:hypothetical protein [Myxococcales bacterium]
MAKLNVTAKAERMLKFLLGLRSQRAFDLMRTRGMTPEDLAEGWALLLALGKVRLSTVAVEPADSSTVLALDAFENLWFPIVQATLARRYPGVGDKLFLNLTQTEGAAVVMSVGTFIERLDAVAAGSDGYGEEGKAARVVLAKRGLTDEIVDAARNLLATLRTPEAAPPPPSPEQVREETDKAESEMWGWYLEWSAIARSTVKSRRLLRELGFLASSGGGASEDEEPDVEHGGAPGPAPAPGEPGAPPAGG